MKKHVYLVQVADNYGPNKFLPLAVGIQWCTAIQDVEINSNWELKDVLIEKLNIKDYVLQLDSPALVAMSCYVWNWNYNCALAKLIKQHWPDCLVVIGGPQVSKTDFLLLKKHPYFDVAVLGENEPAFVDILKSADSKKFDHIPGIMLPGKIIPGESRTRNLDRLVSPILSGFYDKIIAKYPDPERKIQWQVTFETMRGCPYHCAFCDIGEDYWNKTYQFDLNRIYQEIDWMSENQIEYVSVCDSNWGIFERDYDISKYVINKKLETGYPKFWDVSWAKNNHQRIIRMAELDKAAGTRIFRGITFAVQSFAQPALDSVDRFNLSDSVLTQTIQSLRQQQIATYTEMIWPLPGETLESLLTGLQKVIDMGQEDFLMVHPLVLTPNAPLSSQESIIKNGIQYRMTPLDTFWLKIDDADNYITETVGTVYATNTVTIDDTIDGHMYAHWLIVLYYYGWAHMIMRYLHRVHNISQMQFVKDFIQYLIEQKDDIFYQEHNITRNSWADVFKKSAMWGRLIDGVYWEYKSATCVKFHHRRREVFAFIERFVKEKYNVDRRDLFILNSAMCADWKAQYPIELNLDPAVAQCCLNLTADKVKISHWDRGIVSDTEFVKVAYHYQRRSRYWICNVEQI